MVWDSTLVKSFPLKTLFTKDIASLSADDYLEMIVNSLHPKSITLGFNHSFGVSKSGNGDFLKSRENLYNYETTVIDSIKFEL